MTPAPHIQAMARAMSRHYLTSDPNLMPLTAAQIDAQVDEDWPAWIGCAQAGEAAMRASEVATDISIRAHQIWAPSRSVRDERVVIWVRDPAATRGPGVKFRVGNRPEVWRCSQSAFRAWIRKTAATVTQPTGDTP